MKTPALVTQTPQRDPPPEATEEEGSLEELSFGNEEPLVPATPTGVEPIRRPISSSTALICLTIFATMYTLYFTRAVLMPATLGLVLASLLRPLVRVGRRLRLPDAISAAMLLIGVVCAFVVGLVNLLDPAMNWINRAPEHIQAASEKLQVIRQKLAILSEASEQVEQLANGEDQEENDSATADSLPQLPSARTPIDRMSIDETQIAATTASSAQPLQTSDEPVPVELRQPRLVQGLTYLSSTGSILATGLVTIVLAYFFLAAGDTLVNNLLRILPKLHQKRNVVELLHRIEGGLSSYLFTVTVVNIGLGIAVGCGMALLGMPNPTLWGVMAALLNYIPYLGALLGTAVVFVVAVLSFESLSFAFVPPIVYWGLTVIEGCVVTPLLLGRSMSLNPIFVFLALIFWGWMWGIGGALLAVPILAVSKLAFDQFESTRPIGTILGGGTPPLPEHSSN